MTRQELAWFNYGSNYKPRKKPLFDRIAYHTKSHAKSVDYKLIGSDIKTAFSKKPQAHKFLSQASDIFKRWMKNHPKVIKLGIGTGLGFLVYGIGIRIVGSAKLPQMREGYNEMQPSAYSQGIQRKRLKHTLTDFGSKADLSEDNTSSYVAKSMTSERVPTNEISMRAIDSLVTMKGADNSHKSLKVNAAPIINSRILPRHPSNTGDVERGAHRRTLGLSLAMDSKPHLNAMFRASAVAGKGHRIRSADHAKAMNMTLMGV